MPVVRLAFFEGALKPGMKAAFDDYVGQQLTPLWTSFPNLASFRMLRGGSSDDGAYPFVLVLEFTYPSRAAMEEALQSPARMKSREVTKGLFEYFDGRISHLVCEAADYPAAGGV